MSLKIGFANTFYTLWDVTTTTEYTSGGASYQKVSYTYYQNLSSDENQAIEKAKTMGCKDLVIDSELKGVSRSFEKTTKPIYEDWQFRFGKYENDDIRKCNDIDYLKWFYSENKNKYACERVLELDDTLDVYGDEIMTKERVFEIKKYVDSRNKLLEMGKRGETIDVTFTSNIGYDFPTVKTLEYGEMLFVAPCKAMSYQGFDYKIPKVDGKGKRIKNKKLSVVLGFTREFNEDGDTTIETINF